MDSRRRDLAQIHIAKKDLALDDETYRSVLIRVAGVDSSADLDARGRAKVLDEFKRLGWTYRKPGRKRAGARRQAHTPIANKARALWVSLYQLGEIDDAREEALAAFAARQTGVDDPAWITPQQGYKLVEALKARCARAGYAPTDEAVRRVLPAELKDAPDARARGYNALLIAAQWDKLIELGAMKSGVHARIDTWLFGRGFKAGYPGFLDPADQRRAIELLGGWIRKVKAARVSANPTAPVSNGAKTGAAAP